MPTYEYLCEKCEHEFEREQSINDPPVKTCPKCRSRRVKKLISRTSFVLKGGGWYNDLYSSSKPDAKPEAKSEPSSDSSTSSESSAPPKKDSKKESKGSKGKSSKSTGKSAA